mgnify:CR=1 FL=1
MNFFWRNKFKIFIFFIFSGVGLLIGSNALLTKYYFKPIRKITSESLKVFAREIYSCGKETDIETLRRLLNHGNMELAAQISTLHRKIESIKSRINLSERYHIVNNN